VVLCGQSNQQDRSCQDASMGLAKQSLSRVSTHKRKNIISTTIGSNNFIKII
jgi:hypothetical protein